MQSSRRRARAPTVGCGSLTLFGPFSQDGKTHDFAEANPFKQEGEDVASVAYRYRKFVVSDAITMLVRCQVDGVLDAKEGGEKQFMTSMALNEFDPRVTGVDWRRKLESQRGAVLANELKNNSNKLGRWTVRSLLAGADLMKLGFVSRSNPTQKWNHQILSSQFYKPREFARQINLNMDNMWGIIRYMVDMVKKQPPGKYVLLKDPNKQGLLFYKVPQSTFEDDSSEEDSDEDDDDEDDSDDDEEEAAEKKA